jgi:hypothetical protein
VLSQLTVAISGLTQVGEGEAGRGIGDAGWKNSSRTACASIKSLKTLVDTERLVRSMERMLFRGLDGSCTQILVGLGWSEETTEYFLNNSRFCNLNRTMYRDYLGLLGELIRMHTMFGNFAPVQSALDWYTCASG